MSSMKLSSVGIAIGPLLTAIVHLIDKIKTTIQIKQLKKQSNHLLKKKQLEIKQSIDENPKAKLAQTLFQCHQQFQKQSLIDELTQVQITCSS